MFRRLRQRHQQRRFAERQPPRLLAEIGERGCPHPFEIAAIGRERQIKPEDLVLAERPFELQCPNCLPDLGIDRTPLPRFEQPGDLHGERRAARDDAAVGDELVRGPHHGQGIDASMDKEALVLIGEQRFEKAGIDLLARRRQPPAAFAGEIGPEQLAVAVEHDFRHFEVAAERRRSKRLEHADHAAGDCRHDPHRADRRERPRGVSTCAARLGSLLILPARPRPCRFPCGRSDRAGTCLRPPPEAARKFRATPRGRHRPRYRWSGRPCAARTPR